jgi:6-pyruvoyltetrahydropterin/6-carboxytetrahydropterin synthase
LYRIKTEASFDSAHFLRGHGGKCKNIHGHGFKVAAVLESDVLKGGMVVDFAVLKRDLTAVASELDHALIYEEGSLKPTTAAALLDEGFRLVPLPFAPTAENLAEYFYNRLREKGYDAVSVTVFETEKNCAEYL